MTLVVPSLVRAQHPSPPTLGAVVVVAERTATPINQSTAAVTRLSAADISRLPYTTVADVLRHVPGIAVVDFDGAGRDPQLMTRGFYGGGEAEYVLVLVDGRPANLTHNGTVAWETLPPLSAIAAIEVVRGSASALYGDAAVAGVINIVTRTVSGGGARWLASAESYGGLSASVGIARPGGWRAPAVSLGVARSGGFREHAGRSSASASGSMRLFRQLRGTIKAGWRDFDEPGPLLASRLTDGSESDPRFRRDGGRDSDAGLALHHDGSLGVFGIVNTVFRLGARRAGLTRTLPLSPEFGDTRERELRTTTAGLGTQVDLVPPGPPFGISRLSIGLSADVGTLDSRYFSTAGTGITSEDSRGDGMRSTLAGFVHLAGRPSEMLRWILGLRADYLRDAFDEVTAPPGAPFSPRGFHGAVSPKAGMNIRYAPTGRLWLSASRTFKAPTLDQLYDRRPVPIPFPPFSVTTSNPDLDPQRGTSIEAGLYHDLAIASAAVSLSVTAYQIAMRDELDFDLRTFRYVNIAQSRRHGTEAALTIGQGPVSAQASISLQDAVSRSGANSGKRLKAVPGQVYSAGMTMASSTAGAATVSVSRMAGMFIDDANTRRIPSWTRVDVQASYPFGGVDVIAGARNLLDARYNSTAFLDPGGTDQAYVYPAAGRIVTIGMRYGR